MAWERRNDRGRYYTRSRRVGGKVVREYYGAGHIADLASALDDLERERVSEERELWKKEKAAIEEADAPVEALCDSTDELVRAFLLTLGYRKHPQKWRFIRMRNQPFEHNQLELTGQSLTQLIQKTEHEECGQALLTIRRRLERFGVWTTSKHHADEALTRTIALAARQNPDLRGTIHKRLAALRNDLLDHSPSRLEELLVDRVAVTWLHVILLQGLRVGDDCRTGVQRQYFRRRATIAHERHALAIKLLSNVKKRIRMEQRRTGKPSIPGSSPAPPANSP
jgi:hypothetical protein